MKKRDKITQEDIERWKSQGWGQGEGKTYKPWLTVRDLSSKGMSGRPKSLTVGREHHLLSDLEEVFFLYADYSPSVIDIREQYPFLPERISQRIAQELGIRHPRYRNSDAFTVITLDFLLTMRRADGSNFLIGRSIKPSSRLVGRSVKRTLAKLEIERRCATYRGIPWNLVTEREFDPQVVTNLTWLNYSIHIDDPTLLARIPEFLAAFKLNCRANRHLAEVLDRTADTLQIAERSQIDELFHHCAWRRLINLDLHVPLGPQEVPRVLSISGSDQFSEVKGYG